jgi:hypothetical protein
MTMTPRDEQINAAALTSWAWSPILVELHALLARHCPDPDAAVMEVVRVFGGGVLYIPVLRTLARRQRDAAIRRELAAAADRVDRVDCAQRHALSPRQLRRILAAPCGHGLGDTPGAARAQCALTHPDGDAR